MADKKTKDSKVSILGGGFLMKHIRYISFVVFLGVLYMNSVRVGDQKLIEIKRLENQIRQTKWELLGVEKRLMGRSSATKLERELDGKVVFPKEGPRVLKVPKS